MKQSTILAIAAVACVALFFLLSREDSAGSQERTNQSNIRSEESILRPKVSKAPLQTEESKMESKVHKEEFIALVLHIILF